MSEGVTGSDGGGGRLIRVGALDIATILQCGVGAGNILWSSCELLSAGVLQGGGGPRSCGASAVGVMREGTGAMLFGNMTDVLTGNGVLFRVTVVCVCV